MKLAFDLHGVIMHLMPVMQKYFKEVLEIDLVETNRFNFDLPDSYAANRIGVDIANSIKTMAVKYAKPVYGSIPALKRWRDAGNEILIVSATAKSTIAANCEWLTKHLGTPYRMVRTTHQEGKVKTLKELGVTHFVDDRFKTCNQLADHLEHVYLFDAPCNRGRIPKANVTRVNSLRRVFNLL
jgi:uncharacterized HAD superfamily protein